MVRVWRLILILRLGGRGKLGKVWRRCTLGCFGRARARGLLGPLGVCVISLGPVISLIVSVRPVRILHALRMLYDLSDQGCRKTYTSALVVSDSARESTSARSVMTTSISKPHCAVLPIPELRQDTMANPLRERMILEHVL